MHGHAFHAPCQSRTCPSAGTHHRRGVRDVGGVAVHDGLHLCQLLRDAVKLAVTVADGLRARVVLGLDAMCVHACVRVLVRV